MTRKGTDTGFWLRLGVGHPQAVGAWKDAVAGNMELLVSTVSISELLAFYYRHGKPLIGERLVRRWIRAAGVRLVIVTEDIAWRAGGYRHGLGLPTVDSVILATAVMEGCDELLTTDSHFLIAMTQGVIAVTVLS
ncbi:MAG: PIN domain-containing protein [Abditibacteriales bacterium]|nr:PIN domain-containing protein [Abditibacteriales bacterium]